MDLTLAYSPLALVLALLAAGALTWWTYGRSTPSVTGGRRLLLSGLRFAALFVVLLLLFDPILKRIQATEEPPVLAVLVDKSQSLTADPEGDGPAQDGATAIRAALASLPDDEAVRVYAFDASTTRVPDTLDFDGARTDIASALQYVERDLDGQNLRGILLLSDGRYNTGRNPLYLAERARVPIYTSVVGDTTAQVDVRIGRVVTNDIAYVGNALPVRVGVRATGFEGTRATVSLLDNGRSVASQPVTLPADGVETSLDLDVLPSEPGLRRFTVAVSRQAGEVTYRNNTETVAVRVLDTKRRVLLLAAAPGPDLTALRAVLDDDPNVEVVPRTQRAPGSFYEGSLPEDLDRFDAVVLAGYPGRAADAATRTRVASAIQDGLPALFVLTRQSDLGALDAAFGETLPVRPAAVRGGFVEASAVVTPAGSTHPVLQIPGLAPAALGGLPPVSYNESRWVPSPDARVLLSTRRGSVALSDPLLAVRSQGRVRTAALLGAGTWRWATLPTDLESLELVFPTLTDNLLRWITAREDRRPVRVRPDRALFGDGEPVTFTGQVYDESIQPIDNADVRVTVRLPDGSETPYTMRPLGTGRYALDAGTLPPGDYRFSASASRGTEELGSDAGAFAVGALALEFREPGADADLMRGLAHRSGGRVISIADVGSLRDRLAQEGRFGPRRIEEERSTPLLHFPLLLAFVIVCLTAEWFLRKRSGMV